MGTFKIRKIDIPAAGRNIDYKYKGGSTSSSVFSSSNSGGSWLDKYFTLNSETDDLSISKPLKDYYTKESVNTELEKKVNTSLFDSLFELKTDSNGKQYIQAKHSLISVGEITAFSTDDVNVPSIFDSLSKASKTSHGIVQVGTGINVLNGIISIDQTALTPQELSLSGNTLSISGGSNTVDLGNIIPDLSGYATETWATGQFMPKFTANTAFNKNFGTTSGTVAQGNDSRILNGQTAFNWGNHASAGYQANISAGTTSQYFRGDKTWQTLNTSAVAEGTRLYFTSARAVSAITGGASTIATSNLTASRALVSNSSGKVAVSDVTSTELSRIKGVTSSVQTQINSKLATTAFNNLFELVTPTNGDPYIQAKYSVASVGELVAYTSGGSIPSVFDAIPIASTTNRGLVQIGDGLKISGGIVSVDGDTFNLTNYYTKTQANGLFDLKLDASVFNARTISAGNGLTGGGALSANRTITLGTPSQITNDTSNAVYGDSHTHYIDFYDPNTADGNISDSGLWGNGIRIGQVGNNNTTYPTGYGTLLTVKQASMRMFQFLHGHLNNGLWHRPLYGTQSVSWKRIYNDDYHPDADKLGGVDASDYVRKTAANTLTGTYIFDSDSSPNSRFKFIRTNYGGAGNYNINLGNGEFNIESESQTDYTGLVMDSSNRFGMGRRPEASFRLSVNGSGRFYGNITTQSIRLRDANGIGVIENTGNQATYIYGGSADNSQNLILGSAYTNRIGVFTNTPQADVHINKDVLISGNIMANSFNANITSGDALYLNGGNNDVNIWRVDGGSAYGFYERYRGSGSGNDNALDLYSNNQTGTDVLVRTVLQDGNVTFHKNVNVVGDLTSSGTKVALQNVSINAGNGLSGGGAISASRTITLGTPSTITNSTTNSVTSTSHTHEIDLRHLNRGYNYLNVNGFAVDFSSDSSNPGGSWAYNLMAHTGENGIGRRGFTLSVPHNSDALYVRGAGASAIGANSTNNYFGTWRRVYTDNYHPDADNSLQLGGVNASNYLRSDIVDKFNHLYVGYDWTTKRNGIHIGVDGLNSGLSFYEPSVSVSASIFRDTDSTFYLGARSSDNNKGIAISSTGLVTAGAGLNVNGNLSVSGTINGINSSDWARRTVAQTITGSWSFSGLPTINRSGQDVTLLRFNTDRQWQFRQINSGASAGLALVSEVGSKEFDIRLNTGTRAASFFVADGGTKVSLVPDGGSVDIGGDLLTKVVNIRPTTNAWGNYLNIISSTDATKYTSIINDAAGFKIRNFGGGGHYYFRSSTNSTLFFINDNGNVAIGSENANEKLRVVGNIAADGNITAQGEVTAYSSSDKRLKSNITPLTSSLSIIDKLNPVSFNWNNKAVELNNTKNTLSKNYGVIAQEIEKVLPDLVHETNGFKSVDYIQLIGVLLGAVKELNNKIKKLENK